MANLIARSAAVMVGGFVLRVHSAVCVVFACARQHYAVGFAAQPVGGWVESGHFV